jgi:hypothetical protein
LLYAGKTFGEFSRIIPAPIIHAGDNYLAFGVDVPPFAVLLYTGKSFGERSHAFKLLVKQAVSLAIYKISLAMSGIYGYNHSWGVIFALLATLPPSAHHRHQYAEKEELNAFHKVFRFWCIQYCLSKGMSF